MALYVYMGKEVATFQLKSGLLCPQGCGRCRPTADVQVIQSRKCYITVL